MKKLATIIREIESEEKTQLDEINSGFKYLDTLTGGFKKGELILIGSRPAIGKTTLASNIIINSFHKENASVLIFSFELSAKQLTKIILKTEAHFDIFNHSISDTLLLDSNIYIDDTVGNSVLDLMDRAVRHKQEKDVDLIIIDYLQLIPSIEDKPKKNEFTKQKFEIITHLLKFLALSLNLPILLLSQLPRQVDKRPGDKRPMLIDLLQFGKIERFIDVVLFIYRPAYYGIIIDEMGKDVENQTELIIAKNKNGKCATIKLRHDFEKAKFWDWS